MQAADVLAQRGVSASVVNLPFLNTVDGKWLGEAAGSAKLVAVIDNHYRVLGQGDRVCTPCPHRPSGPWLCIIVILIPSLVTGTTD